MDCLEEIHLRNRIAADFLETLVHCLELVAICFNSHRHNLQIICLVNLLRQHNLADFLAAIKQPILICLVELSLRRLVDCLALNLQLVVDFLAPIRLHN